MKNKKKGIEAMKKLAANLKDGYKKRESLYQPSVSTISHQSVSFLCFSLITH